jgi:hypothetical protein
VNHLVIASSTVLAQAPTGGGYGVSIVVSGLLLVRFPPLASVLGGRAAGALVRRAGSPSRADARSLVPGLSLAAFGLLHAKLWQLTLTATGLAAATPPEAAWPECEGSTTIAAIGVTVCLATTTVTWLLPGQSVVPSAPEGMRAEC